MQAVRPSIEPIGESRPDWEVFAALSILLGTPMEYAESKDILKEIRGTISGYTSLGPTPLPPTVDSTAMDRFLSEDTSRISRRATNSSHRNPGRMELYK